MENSTDFEDFKNNAPLLHVKMDFSHKHATFFYDGLNYETSGAW